jgi:hypothetical protein
MVSKRLRISDRGILDEIFSIKKLLQVNLLQELSATKAVKGEPHHLI